MPAAPPGWYPDPYGPRPRLRWWTGTHWTWLIASSSSGWLGPVAVVLLFVMIEAAITIAMLGGLVLDHLGCGSVDPTNPANYSSVVIRNDTPRPVVVGDCRGAYCSEVDALLQLGRSIRVDAACGVAGGDMTSYRVRTPRRRTLGFIAVRTPRKHDGIIYDISRASPTRDDATCGRLGPPAPPGTTRRGRHAVLEC